MIEHEAHGLILTEAHLLQPIDIARALRLAGVCDEVALTRGEARASLGVTALARHGVEFAVVVQLELHLGVRYRSALRIPYLHEAGCCMGVALDDIDLGVGRRAADDGLGPIVAPEGLGMDEHGTGHGGIEPR